MRGRLRSLSQGHSSALGGARASWDLCALSIELVVSWCPKLQAAHSTNYRVLPLTRVLPGSRQGQGALGTLLLGLPAVSIGVGFPGLQPELPPPRASCPVPTWMPAPRSARAPCHTMWAPSPCTTLWPSGSNTCASPGELRQRPGIVFNRRQSASTGLSARSCGSHAAENGTFPAVTSDGLWLRSLHVLQAPERKHVCIWGRVPFRFIRVLWLTLHGALPPSRPALHWFWYLPATLLPSTCPVLLLVDNLFPP